MSASYDTQLKHGAYAGFALQACFAVVAFALASQLPGTSMLAPAAFMLFLSGLASASIAMVVAQRIYASLDRRYGGTTAWLSDRPDFYKSMSYASVASAAVFGLIGVVALPATLTL
jgi:3-methyladenine DNA glycosylase/8-oxoguanine DNA glycosylase